MAYKGKYKVKNRSKYKGDADNVIYRSLWERQVMVYFDTNSSVKDWSSEEIIVWYISPIDGKSHRYFPDFWARILNITGEIETLLIEVKPLKQTKPPKQPKRRTKKFLIESKAWIINQAKWQAAIKFCKEKGWKFKILTEKNLVGRNK